jgi:hypothetical protein
MVIGASLSMGMHPNIIQNSRAWISFAKLMTPRTIKISNYKALIPK